MICKVDPFPHRLHELFLQKAAALCELEIDDISYSEDNDDSPNKGMLCITFSKASDVNEKIFGFDAMMSPFKSYSRAVETAYSANDDQPEFWLTGIDPSGQMSSRDNADRAIECFYIGQQSNRQQIKAQSPEAVQVIDHMDTDDDFVRDCIKHHGGTPFADIS